MVSSHLAPVSDDLFEPVAEARKEPMTPNPIARLNKRLTRADSLHFGRMKSSTPKQGGTQNYSCMKVVARIRPVNKMEMVSCC